VRLRSHILSALRPHSEAFRALSLMPTAVHSWKPSEDRASNVCNFDKASICLLDDDFSMLKALDRLLKSDGFNVERFQEPETFLAAVGKSPCRVAILDVWMPEMNGLEVQAALRKTAPETRVIFISGRDDPSVRETALEAGAYGFLSKPFDDEVFLQLVRKAVAG
jgi:FixJ family two-component response regulator